MPYIVLYPNITHKLLRSMYFLIKLTDIQIVIKQQLKISFCGKMTLFGSKYQRRIQYPVEQLRWSFSTKIFNRLSR